MRIVDVTLTGKTLCFSDGTTREASAKECSYFKRRKKLIAYPIKVKDADGSPVLAEDGTPKERYEIIRWADIHRHSWYSLLDGCTSIKNMVSHTEGAGGITDHGVMCGVMQFYAAMKKAEKIPIVGQEFYCETINGEKKGNHLILLAKNETGYKNLVKLSSMAYDNFYYKPHISYEMLEAHHDGLICSSACIGGEIPQMFLAAEKNPEDAEEYIAKANVIIAWFRRVFGDDFYLEVQRHGIADEDLVMPKIIQYARENNIHMIATTDSHYVSKEDHEAHDVLLCIATGKTFADEKRMKFEGTGYHLHTADEVEDLFFDIPDALDNTLEIVKKCAGFHITTGKYYLPKYPVPDGYEDEYSYLDKLAHDGFKVRYAGIRRTKKWQEYSERLEYELSVIKKMGFAGYFLIVWDFLNFAHENGIPTGPGRGCTNAGTLIYTDRGLVPIENISIGDKVYTHDGTMQPVLATFKYPLEKGESLNRIRCYYGDNFGNAYTDNHKILAIKAKRETDKRKLSGGVKYAYVDVKEPQWIEAKDLEVGDMVAFPKFKVNNKAIVPEFDLFRFASSDCTVTESQIIETRQRTVWHCPRYAILDEQDMFFLGMMTGNGWLHRRGAGVGICFKKGRERTDVLDHIKNKYGFVFSPEKGKGRSVASFSCYSTLLKNIFLSFWSGYNYSAQTKTFPDFVFSLPDSLKMAFINGLWETDGSHKGKSKYTSASYDLICKIKVLLSTLNIPNGMAFRPRHDNIGAKVEHSSDSWQITVPHNFNVITRECGECSAEYVFKRIYRIDKVTSDFVYDISVRDNRSYVTSNFAAHNSGAGSIVLYSLQITDIDPMKYGLLFERFLNPSRISMPDCIAL